VPNKNAVLDTLRLLATLSPPVWLAGGLAADFHVGRWTRDHDDIDLLTYEEHRKALSEEFGELGFRQTQTHGWITHWKRFDQDKVEVSVAYERRVDQTTGQLIIRPEDAGDRLIPGIYPGVPGNLDPTRYRTLEGVRFRVVSAEDEWVFAKGYRAFRPAASRRVSVEHNLSLLETILNEDDRKRLLPFVGRRLPLNSADHT
jgi:hypothetical protein